MESIVRIGGSFAIVGGRDCRGCRGSSLQNLFGVRINQYRLAPV